MPYVRIRHMKDSEFRCIVHGSFSKHFQEIKDVCKLFQTSGIEVLAPKNDDLIKGIDNFFLFKDETDLDPRYVELLYLHNLKQLGENGFSYFVNPDGYIGKSSSYELGIAQISNVRCFFSSKPKDHPVYIQDGSIWSADNLAKYIKNNRSLPLPFVKVNEKYIHKLWEELIVPGSIVATGAIIEHQPKTSRPEKEILLVKTHKWGNRYSIVGGKVRRNERLEQSLLREVKEETQLSGEIGTHICTFDQIKNSGYYQKGVQHIFIDNVVRVKRKSAVLNDEAQDYLWALPKEALSHLDIEPNAKKTILAYTKLIATGINR